MSAGEFGERKRHRAADSTGAVVLTTVEHSCSGEAAVMTLVVLIATSIGWTIAVGMHEPLDDLFSLAARVFTCLRALG
jgi:hypothetical protein